MCERSPQAITMQVAGSACCIGVNDFASALERSPSLHRLLLRFVHTQIVQRDENALAASNATIAERLARWLLMVADRLRTPDLPLTHELIAAMLSTRRASITVVLAQLKSEGLITMGRGLVGIINRPGLTKLAGQYYGERLLVSQLASVFLRSPLPRDGLVTTHPLWDARRICVRDALQ